MDLDTFKPYFNNPWGFIAHKSQKPHAFGDSCNRLGCLGALLRFGYYQVFMGKDRMQFFRDEVKKITVYPGRYRRSPCENEWHFNPDCLTRDQKEQLEAGMLLNGMHDELMACWLELKKNGFRHQNNHKGCDCEGPECITSPDLPSPREFAIFIRGLFPKWRWLLSVLDLGLLLSVKKIEQGKANTDSDHKLAIHLMIACRYYPTFVGKYAFKRYVKTKYAERLFNYFREDVHDGFFPLYELYLDAIDKTEKGYL